MATVLKSGLQICEKGQSIPVRPTLIIGLGGTGAIALKWTNHLLRELTDYVPPFVKQLVFDSDAKDDQEGPDTVFPDADYYNLFENLHLSDVVVDFEKNPDKHPHLHWLNKLDLPSAVTERGCQGIPRLGRVVFYETMGDLIFPAIRDRMEALADVRLVEKTQHLPPSRQFHLVGSPVVHIISSACGGTGAGLLLDLAYAVQWWTSQIFHAKPEVIGHIMLPEAFHLSSQQVNDKLRAVCGNLLKQIEFFMDERRPPVKLTYPNGVSHTIGTKDAPFSSCYLINGYGPRGGDRRTDLCELIARMVRSMVVEPSCREIQSDVNNKQLDVLATKDRSTKRIMCFSSYGLRYGTAKSPGAKGGTGTRPVMKWICQSMLDLLEEEPDEENPDDQAKAILKQLEDRGSELKEALAEREFKREVLRQVPSGLNWEFADEDRLKKEGAADQLKFIEKLLGDFGREVNNIITEGVRKSAGKAFRKAEDKLNQFLDAADYSRYRAVVLAAQLKFLQEEHDNVQPQAFGNAWLQFVINPVLKKIKEDCEPGIDLSDHLEEASDGSNDIVKSQTDRVLSANDYRVYEKLIDSISYDLRGAALKQLRKKVDQEVEFYKHIVTDCHSFIERESLIDTHLGGYEQMPTGRPYATQLFDVDHPVRWYDRLDEAKKDDNSPDTKIRREFLELRQDIMAGFRAADATDEHGKRIARAFSEEKIELKMAKWMHNYHDRLSTSFSLAVDERDPNSHPMFDPTKDLVHRSEPKISIDHRGRHSPSMRLVVSQHPKESCVQKLMETHVGLDYRGAVISKDFIKSQDIWFQVMNFHFGFCLPALDNFEDYVGAEPRYLEPIVFDPDDLWLDPTWPDLYSGLLERVDADRKKFAKNLPESSEFVIQRAARIKDLLRRFDRALQKCFATLTMDCEHFTFEDQKEGMDCISELKLLQRESLAELGKHLLRPDQELTNFPSLAGPIVDRIDGNYFEGFLQPTSPMFALVADPYVKQLREDFEALALEYDLP